MILYRPNRLFSRYNLLMELNEHIFRANDIRGVSYRDLTEEVIYKLGKALGSEAQDRGINEFIIGRDGRLSSPDMFEWLSSGVISTGCGVIDIGIVTSPMFYHSTFWLNSSSGVVITGSHNPGEYNGFKIVFNNQSTSSDEILLLKKRMLNNDFKDGSGMIKGEAIEESYINKIVENINLEKKLNISIDCGNGAAGVVAKKVYERLGCNVIELFGELDGSFPNHHPDPSRVENMQDLIDSVKNNDSSIGLAFDGDADRLGVISPDGEMIYPDRQMILFARQVIQSSPNAKVVFDVKCSKLLSDEILKLGGEPLICKQVTLLLNKKSGRQEHKLGVK